MTNKEKAQAILNSFSTGDSTYIKEYISSDNYVEHNLNRASGRQSLLEELPLMRQRGMQVNIKRTFEDKDKVFLHSEYLDNDKQLVAFDIFRFENGVVVEHWDNFELIVPVNPSGRTQIDGPTESEDLSMTEENKSVAEGAVKDVLMGQHPERVTNYFEGNKYLQHHVGVGDGLDTLVVAIKKAVAEGKQSVYIKIHQVLGEGNFVLTASEGRQGQIPIAFYDLFRIENKKIAEHWDILEIIPEVDKRVNSNGKF